MIHLHLPSDQHIVDAVFSLAALPNLEKASWLLAMIATFGKTPKQLKGFSWNEDNTINILSKKRSVKPLHPQWVYLFQLKEKQPSDLDSCWESLIVDLKRITDEKAILLTIENLLLSYKVRKICYVPIKQQLRHLTTAH